VTGFSGRPRGQSAPEAEPTAPNKTIGRLPWRSSSLIEQQHMSKHPLNEISRAVLEAVSWMLDHETLYFPSPMSELT